MIPSATLVTIWFVLEERTVRQAIGVDPTYFTTEFLLMVVPKPEPEVPKRKIGFVCE